MSIRLRWSPRVTGDSQSIYRSESIFDADSLPVALVSVDADVSFYEDTTTEQGKTYFYAVSIILGGRSALSEVVSIGDTSDTGEDIGFQFEETVVGLGDVTQLVGSTFVAYGSVFAWSSDSYGHVEWSVDVLVGWEEAIDAGLEVFIWEVTTDSHTDNDWGAPFVRFEDEFGVSFGGYFTSSISNNSPIDYVHKVAIPEGTRTIFYGWLAKRESGTELSFYPSSTFTVKIEPVSLHFAAITRLMGFWDIPNDAAEVATWTSESGTGAVFYSAAQWDSKQKWLLDGRLLAGLNTASTALYYKKIFLPDEYKSGDVLFELTGIAGSVNGSDGANCEMYLYDDTDTLIGVGIGFTTVGSTVAYGNVYAVARKATKQINMSGLGVTPSYVKVKIRLSGGGYLDAGIACLNLQVSKAL